MKEKLHPQWPDQDLAEKIAKALKPFGKAKFRTMEGGRAEVTLRISETGDERHYWDYKIEITRGGRIRDKTYKPSLDHIVLDDKTYDKMH